MAKSYATPDGDISPFHQFMIDSAYLIGVVSYKASKWGLPGLATGFLDGLGYDVKPWMQAASIAGPSVFVGACEGIANIVRSAHVRNILENQSLADQLIENKQCKQATGMSLKTYARYLQATRKPDMAKEAAKTGLANTLSYGLGRGIASLF